ncbi:MFS general substrate transporter [Wilcoxina mikolae CBS 423.85]|nr:MFS general substrate transporter [Wilcoxina mikolae CBS 423.85]
MSQLYQSQPNAQPPSTATSVTLEAERIKQIEAGSVVSTSTSTGEVVAGEVSKEDATEGHVEELEKQETYVSQHNPRAFPDGGLKAWLCVFGAFCCLFCSFGWINAVGIFQSYYQSNQLKAYSPSSIAWISGLETFFMFFGGAIVGKMFDAYGPRYILLLGTFLHVFGLMMASISHEYWHFVLSQGICSAVGASMIFYPAVGSVSTWFYKRRAFALGITASGSSLGGVIFPIMIRRLIVHVGFGWSMRITAFLILAMMVIANLTLVSRLSPQGATPWTICEFTRHFKDFPYTLMVCASFLFFFGMFLPFNYLPLYGLRHDMSVDLANYLISILNAASIFGRIIPGYIGDKIGRFNMMVMISYLSTFLVFALWTPSTGSIPIILFAALYGFSTGAFVSLAPALVAQISDIREFGVRSGALFAVVSFGALTGNPIAGALVSKYDGGFRGAQIFAGSMLMGASALFLATRWKLAGSKLKTKV